MAKIKLGIAKLNASSLYILCLKIEEDMMGNPHFPDPMPTLAELGETRRELERLEVLGSSGDRVVISQKNTTAKQLKDMLRLLSHYVAAQANGDENILLSSGFGIRKKPSPLPGPLKLDKLTAKRTDRSGSVKVRWKPVSNAVTCQVEFTTEDPNSPTAHWTAVAITSKSKVTIGNLTPGTYYWFRAKAYGRRHEGAYSDPAVVMAA